MAENHMMNIGDCQLGLYEKALTFDWDWEKKLSMVKELGFDFMEFSVDADHKDRLDFTEKEITLIRDTSWRLQVPLNTLALTANRFYPLGSKNDEVREEGKLLVKKAVALAVKLGIRIVQIAAYDVFDEEGDEETDRLFIESMRECEPIAARAGVMLAFETMDSPYAGSVERCKRLVDILGSPWIHIYADTGNIAAIGLDFTKDILTGPSHLIAIHLKDATPGISRDIEFGTGIVDFDADFKALKQINYGGFFIAEMWWQDNPEYLDKVKEASRFLREKIKTADMA